ncbi:hypothetical protein [Streptomyces niveus]|uniref:hypothetical protein n=1 Tax=Streptomyces niveus TaxID=193462 RepID=UPI00341A07B8
MRKTKAHFYVWRRSDGYVDASNGYLPTGAGSRGGFEQLAEGEDWDAMRGVILVERGELRVDESAHYHLHLTTKPWFGKEPTARQWSVDGVQLRSLLWEYAAGGHPDLPEGSYLDTAEYMQGGVGFLLGGFARGGRFELVVMPTR